VIVTKGRARPSAARIEEIAPPTNEELRLIRDPVDPTECTAEFKAAGFRFKSLTAETTMTQSRFTRILKIQSRSKIPELPQRS
jgi:hypothetical protein